MDRKAGFLKRVSAFVVDISFIAIICWALYAACFQFIIGNSIYKNYNKEIKKPYESISESYSGSTSLFGKSTTGYFGELQGYYVYDSASSSYSQGSMNSEIHNKYLGKVTSQKTEIEALVASIPTLIQSYDAEASLKEQFISKMYMVYEYITEAKTIMLTYKVNDSFVEYSSLESLGEINETQQAEYEQQYTDSINAIYNQALSALSLVVNKYEEIHNIDLAITLGYKYIEDGTTVSLEKKISEVEGTYSDTDSINAITAIISKYQTYYTGLLSKITTSGEGEALVYNESAKSYTFFYYALHFEQFQSRLSFYEYVYLDTMWVLTYSLISFAVLLTIYVSVMRGQTFGRRLLKIKVVSTHDMDKVRIVSVILHDVFFRVLYLLAIFIFSPLIALIAMLGFLIADFIMIKFSRKKLALRDLITGLKVVEK